MILIKKISLHNFLSHDNTEIKFEDNCKLEISGKSGSGKTAIVEAIIWCLYGISRVENKNLIRKGEKSTKVTLWLFDNKNEKEYKIERTINEKNKHDISVYEKTENEQLSLIKENGVKAIQKYIEKDILKSSYELFVNSIIYPQESIDSFVKQTASKRKDLLLEIINIDDYDQYLKTAKEKEREEENEKSVISGAVEELNLKIIDDNKVISEEPLILKEIESVKSNLNNKEKEKENKLLEKEIVSKKLIEISLIEDSILNIKKEILELSVSRENKKKELESASVSDEKILQIKDRAFRLKDLRNQLGESEKIYQKYLEWNKQMNSLIMISPMKQDYEYQIDALNKQIISIMSEKIENCPQINKPCPIIEDKNNERIKEIEQQINEYQSKKNDRDKELEEHQKKVDAIGECPEIDLVVRNKLIDEIKGLESSEKELEDINNLISKKELISKELENIKNEINKKTAEAEELDKKINDGGKENKELLMEIDKKLSELNLDINNINTQLNEFLAKKMIIDNAKNNIEKSSKRLETLNKNVKEIEYKIECLSEIKTAFGQNGIRAIIIDYFIPILEEKINGILEKLSDFKIKFYTQKSGSGKDVVVDGLFIAIIDGLGREFDFNNYSGGEKMRIMFAIFEGMATIQKCGFRVFDESIVGLDNETTESFTDVMMQFKNNINQLICISHIQGVKDLFDDKIEVVKVNGVSKIIN